jgi:hypothetical protein
MRTAKDEKVNVCIPRRGVQFLISLTPLRIPESQGNCRFSFTESLIQRMGLWSDPREVIDPNASGGYRRSPAIFDARKIRNPLDTVRDRDQFLDDFPNIVP